MIRDFISAVAALVNLALDRLDIIRQSISLMLDRLNYEPDRSHRRLFAWVRSFMLENLGQGKSYNIFDRGGNILSDLASAMDGVTESAASAALRRLSREQPNAAVSGAAYALSGASPP